MSQGLSSPPGQPVLPSGSFAEGTPILMDELIPGNMVTP